ncbi:MAG: DUF2378 family protein [Deltaproteobacteria bacterium]|nr:DUF2378 family protein [Deltaproteobacteria bacterium]
MSLSTPLTGSVDGEERFSHFPRHYTIKGMYFSRVLKTLGDGLQSVEGKLLEPPRMGRYLPFRDYPQLDYSRLCLAAATRSWPVQPVPEAMRRLARLDFQQFAGSRVGRVTLALTGDLKSSLSKLPDMYRMSIKGGRVVVREEDDGLRVDFEDFYGWPDCYALGTLEGMVQHYGKQPRIHAAFHSESNASYLVHLS